MAQRVVSLLLPDSRATVLLSQIGRVKAFPNGVGIYNHREKMIGWVVTEDEIIAALVVEMIDDLINNPNRGKKPDWSMITKKDA